ncbi:MAG: hypothetical protein FWH57_09175 [Oscillospiraceae bacterium]|nr:hypothetical protein [Oscillospiraceae bacterium]
MKRIITIFEFVLSIMLIACVSPMPDGVDRTVKVDSFEVPIDAEISVVGMVADMAIIYVDAVELSEVAETIVRGEVLQTYYTDFDAHPWTFYDLKISAVYRGDLGINDTITVCEYGGYIRGSVWSKLYGEGRTDEPISEDVLYFFSFFGAPLPKAGDEYVLFLVEEPSIAGTFSLVGDFMGKYVVNGESVSRHTPESEPYFYYARGYYVPDQSTIGELKKAINTTQIMQ